MSLWLLVALAIPLGGMAQEAEPSDSPSLAELARKERERRAAFKEGIRVITNANIRDVKGLVSVAGSPAASGTEAEAETEETVEEGEKERDEAEWQSLFDEARLNLKNAVNRSLVLQLKMNDLRNSYFSENDGSTQARIQQQLQETQQEIDANRREVQTAQQAMSALEQEASAGGLAPDKVRDLVGDIPEQESIQTSPDS